MTAVVCRAAIARLALVAMLVASASFRAQENSNQGRNPAGLETIQVRPNVYAIFGAGANIVVHVGSDGLVVVDTGSADMADKVLQAVKAISPRPIRLIINTNADADHATWLFRLNYDRLLGESLSVLTERVEAYERK